MRTRGPWRRVVGDLRVFNPRPPPPPWALPAAASLGDQALTLEEIAMAGRRKNLGV